MFSFIKKTLPKSNTIEKNDFCESLQKIKLYPKSDDIEGQVIFDKAADILLIISTEFLRLLLRHIKTLVTKYEQATYRDDYGNIELDKATQEVNYFLNKTVRNGLLTAPLPSHIARDDYLIILKDVFFDDPESQEDWTSKIEEFLSIADEEDFISAIESMVFSHYNGTLRGLKGCSEQTMAFLLGDDYKSDIEMVKRTMADEIIKIDSIMTHFIDLEDLSNLQKWFSERHKNVGDIASIVTGQEFEVFCQRQLESLGWRVKTTRTTGDFGADLVIEKNTVSIIIQCKYYSQPVGVKAVQEVFSAMTFYNAHRSAVVTNNSYTKAARQMAEKNNVMLLHINELDKLA